MAKGGCDTGVMLWLLIVVCIFAGCARLEPGRLHTPEERCAMQGGIFLGAGICHTPDLEFPLRP